MSSFERNMINKQYDPVWKALKPDAINACEETKVRFRHSLKYNHKLLEIASPPRDILELACGTGIAAVELARQGYDANGMDCPPEAIEVVKNPWKVHRHRRPVAAAGYAELYSRYARRLHPVLRYCVYQPRKTIKALRQISTALGIGGRCLFQFYNKFFAIQHGIGNHHFFNPSGDLFILDPSHHE